MIAIRMGQTVLARSLLLLGCCCALAAARPHFGGVGAPLTPPRRYFSRLRRNGRWWLLTPNGRVFWMLAVDDVDASHGRDTVGRSYANYAIAKYATEKIWAKQSARRLLSWGFNSLGEYASLYLLPVRGPWGGGWSNPVRMPFVAMIRPALYSLRNLQGFARNPVKDLLAGVDRRFYRGWRGQATPDVFDPDFAAYARGEAQALPQSVRQSRWLIGITSDDADNLVGFGPGPEPQAVRCSPHLGWVAAVTNFEQSGNARLRLRYRDRQVYTKLALKDFLRRQYGTIARLNAAWRSDYSRFGDDGGWGRGRGWLDENGRHAWIGSDSCGLHTAQAAVRRDLNHFVYLYARQYFRATTAALRQAAPGHLVFGPATLNGWGGLTRRGILRAAAENVDVLQANVASQRILQETLAATGKIPIVSWLGLAANADSDLWHYPHAPAGVRLYRTQAGRGQAYRQAVTTAFWRCEAGQCPVVGIKYWAFADSWAEKMNWGLVSWRDNAYDGREAMRKRRHDLWGYSTGGETRDYGNFLRQVRAGNLQILRWSAALARRLGYLPRRR